MVGGDGKSNAGGTHYYNPGSEIELACVVRNRYGQKLNYFLSCEFLSHLPEIKEKIHWRFFSFKGVCNKKWTGRLNIELSVNIGPTETYYIPNQWNLNENFAELCRFEIAALIG